MIKTEYLGQAKSSTKSVNCPTCQQRVAWVEANAHRPFCSERCQLIDFGEWAAEKHGIPGASVYASTDEDDA